MAELSTTDLLPGRVLAVHRGRCRLVTNAGDTDAEVSGRLLAQALQPADLPVVGDWVAVRPTAGLTLIQEVLPRATKLARRAPGSRAEEQVLAANLDLLCVVMGLDGDFNLRRLERYLTLAADSGAEAVVVLNKADLCDQPAERLAGAEQVAAGRPVHLVSVRAGSGVEQLDRYLLAGRTLALLGSSGVGKSSLLNRWLGRDTQAVQAVRADDARGRHTTTHRELFVAPSGALVIDTPGLRELQFWDSGNVADAFADVVALAAECRFGDCQHEGEPGCAVAAALAAGHLDAARLRSYRKLSRELERHTAEADASVARRLRERERQFGLMQHRAPKKR